MAEVIREGQSVRVVLVDGETEASAPVIEKVRQALLEEPIVEVVRDTQRGGDLATACRV